MSPFRKRLKKADSKEYSLATKSGLIDFVLMRSSRRRTMEVSVHDSMEVRVVIPRYVSEKDMQTFIHEKSDWIVKRLKEAKKTNDFLLKKQYKDGNQFLFLGKKYTLRIIEKDCARASIVFDEDKWLVKIPEKNYSLGEKQQIVKEKLVKWYQAQAKEILASRIIHYERIVGLKFKEVAVKGQKNVWGTCGYKDKKINLNWQLVLAPMEVIDYVIVHELVHLKTPDHSKKFWMHVESILPKYKTMKKWLTVNRLEMVLP